MQEAFEKNIEEQLKSFKLQPNDSVWQEVETALHSKKKRVAPFWWMSFAGITLLGSGVMFAYFNSIKLNKHSSTENVSTNTYVKKEVIASTDSKQTNITEKNKLVPVIQSNDYLQKESVKFKAKSIQKNTVIYNKNKGITEPFNTVITAVNNEQSSFEAIDENNEGQIFTPVYEQNKYFIRAELVPIQSLLKTRLKEKKLDHFKNNTQPSAINNTLSEDSLTNKKIKQKKWFITGSAGILTTRQNSLLDNISILDAQSSFSNPGLLTPGVADNNLHYPKGFAAMLGVGFQQQISKKWSYNLALQYKLLSTKTSLPDSLVLGYRSNSFNAHWVEIPLNVYYQINNSSNPFYLTAGLSTAYSFANNWLIANLNNNKFYEDKTKNRSLFLNAQLGAAYTINKSWNVQVSVEKSLTSVHKNVPNKFYYTQFNIQLIKFLQPKTKK